MTAPLALDLEGPVTDGFRTVATFIPKLLGFLVILVVGYFIAKLISKLVDKALEKAGFDHAVERGGIKKALAKSQYDASDIVAKLVFFAIFIPVLSAAIDTLGIEALRQPLAQFIALIPRIIVAIILVVIGAVVAGAVKSLIENTLGGLSYGKVLANAASILILLGFVKSALDQVGIATTVTGPLLYTDPRHRRRCDHRRRGWWPHQADAVALGDHAEQGRGRGRQREGAGPAVPPSERPTPLPATQTLGDPGQHHVRPAVARPARSGARSPRGGPGSVVRAPGENRTPDALLRTEALCPLSYGGGTRAA